MHTPPIAQITVQELADRMAQIGESQPDEPPINESQPDKLQSDKLQLIDVREPEEVAIAYIEGFTNLPLSQFAEWSGQIHTQFDSHAETLVLCHHGVRSAQMCQWLQNQGFTQVKNITGGIEEYAVAVDPTVPRY
jgi:rhodanese-related sulfurtransferase